MNKKILSAIAEIVMVVVCLLVVFNTVHLVAFIGNSVNERQPALTGKLLSKLAAPAIWIHDFRFPENKVVVEKFGKI